MQKVILPCLLIFFKYMNTNNRKNIKFSKHTKNYVIYYFSSKQMSSRDIVFDWVLNNIDYNIYSVHICMVVAIITARATISYPHRPSCSPHRAQTNGE